MNDRFFNKGNDKASVGDGLAVVPHFETPTDAALTKRILTKDDVDEIFFGKIDITSKSKEPKLLLRQSAKMELIRHLISVACLKSNCGQLEFSLNKAEFVNKKLPSGNPIWDQNFKSCRKNLEEYVFDIVTTPIKGHRATGYVFKDHIHKFFNPTQEKQNESNYKPRQKTLELFKSYGHDTNQKQLCPCCNEIKPITKYKIHKEHGGFVGLICTDCLWNQKGKELNIEAWNTAFKHVYAKMKMADRFSLTHKELNLMNVDAMVDDMLSGGETQEITKTCNCCGKEKSLFAFSKDRGSYKKDCKECRKHKAKENRRK